MMFLNAIMHDEKYSTENIEYDLKLIHDWSVKWKMLFNPNITKPADIVFSACYKLLASA